MNIISINRNHHPLINFLSRIEEIFLISKPRSSRPERNYPARQNRPVLQTAVERRSRGFNRRTQIPGIAITITPTLTIIYRGGRWATSRLCPLQMTRHRRNSGVPLCLSLSLLPSRAPSLIKASKLRKRPPLSFERERERGGGSRPRRPGYRGKIKKRGGGSWTLLTWHNAITGDLLPRPWPRRTQNGKARRLGRRRAVIFRRQATPLQKMRGRVLHVRGFSEDRIG